MNKYPLCKKSFQEDSHFRRIPPPLPNEVRITALGDSVTAGCWAQPDLNRFKERQEILHETWQPLGFVQMTRDKLAASNPGQ